MFTGFLDWIRPTHGNFALAGRLKNVINSVLDHVLEDHEPNRTEVEQVSQISFDQLLPPFDELQDLDWLTTIDWTHGSWMEGN
jgi:hypothetical protein